MLLVDIDELRNGNFHLVGPPDKISLLDLILILHTFGLLVEFYRVLNWVWDLRESLLFFAIAELLLLYVDLVSDYHIAFRDLESLDNDRFDETRNFICFLVIDTNLYMAAFVDLVRLELLISQCLMVCDRPIVAQK